MKIYQLSYNNLTKDRYSLRYEKFQSHSHPHSYQFTYQVLFVCFSYNVNNHKCICFFSKCSAVREHHILVLHFVSIHLLTQEIEFLFFLTILELSFLAINIAIGNIWRRKWQPTPIFLPGKCHEWRSLVGYKSMGSQRVGHD